MQTTSKKKRVSLRRWIWRAFASTSLLPLVLVEGVLITTYFITNQSIRSSQIEYLHQSATRDIQASVQQNALLVQGQLEQIHKAIDLYAKSTEHELTEKQHLVAASLSLSADGVRYSAANDGASASFYSNITAPQDQDLYKVSLLANQDFMMKQLKDGDPLIASIYFNSWDSYNRIYPWFNTLEQYPHDMDITQYNFYYLADAQHNPDKKVVWTDVYLDPAGQGWMMSAIAPVYKGDFLEGVAGVDVTVDGILKRIEQLQMPWDGYLMLVNDKLDVMAVPKAGQRDFSLRVENQPAAEPVDHERLQSPDLNLTRHPDLASLNQNLPGHPGGIVALTLNGRPHLVAWNVIPSTGWFLLAVVDEAAVMQETNLLASHYRDVGYLLVAGLVLFYALFFAFMWWRTRDLSRQLSAPVQGVSRMMREIGRGNWQPAESPSDISELWSMSNQALGMGRQLAQAEFVRSSTQQRLELVMESFAEGLWEYYPQRQRFILKGALCQRFGFAANEVPMATLLENIPIEDRQTFMRFLEEARGTASVAPEAEFRIRDVHGKLIWILCRGRMLEPSRLEDASVVVVACVDITTLKQTQLDLREKTLEAEAASTAKSKFISSMSHELRTPLNAIYGFAQLGLMQPPDDASQQTANLQEIIEASEHLMQLMDDLLELSSLQAERPLLDLKPVHVASLLSNCADMVRQQIAAQGQILHTTAPLDTWHVWADKRRLKQVLINLLSNAIKYNRPGGDITLGAMVVEGGARLRLYVTDTGVGIPPALQDELFRPFQRLGKENSSIQGTGIGLALCRDLALLMHGSMGFESHVNVGSTFWIDMYSSAFPAPGRESNLSTIALPRVLLVSSNPKDDEVVREALAGDFELQWVNTLPEASVVLDATAISVLIVATTDRVPVLETFFRGLRTRIAETALSIIVVRAAADHASISQLECQAIVASPLERQSIRHLVLTLATKRADACSPK
ncbi:MULTISPECIES: ATP-binding protein [unclassified Pseudomonas]|uniref:sensor histidine kinase n=1 Tax=unclassified Pseudomonas TaxID=196821 RepID=UPI000881BB3B|nr:MULTISPECIES: ATP-binding protein [unclassified Pseudomonas]SCY73977.1 PAS domain S-box-containing protein [Pseudomonas sp. NFACC37-1]SFN92766.1 PAS domain S-box-containing protein [Pseudomonas sp. NFACC24-1]